MTTLAHVATGYLIGTAAVSILPGQLAPPAIIPFSILMANIPDFDAVIYLKRYNHRHSPTHYPIYWILFALVAGLIYTGLNSSPAAPVYAGIAFINIILHFIYDTFDYTSGIHWLAPFNMKAYSFVPFTDTYPTDYRQMILKFFRYARSPVFIYELAVGTAALFTLFLI